ncbi:mRNA processing protein, putative [Plasmodium sp. gorilla clade G1]|nr:mRNA processing protein, putative [Plasmodium sp. gorilla clade G1]
MTNKNNNYSLWIGNIPFDITENELYEILCKVGVVRNVRIKYDVDKNMSKGFAFCEYKDVETCLLAFKYINGYEIKGRKLKVFWANEEYKDKYGHPTSYNNNNNNDNLKSNNLCDNHINNKFLNNNNNISLYNPNSFTNNSFINNSFINNSFINNSKTLIKNKYDKKKVPILYNEDDMKEEKNSTNIHNSHILNNNIDKSNIMINNTNNDNYIKVNISNIVHTLTTSQIIYILSYFKKLAVHNGKELMCYLRKNKNITYALLHSLFILNIINDYNHMNSLEVYTNYDSLLNKKERILQMNLSNISLDYKKKDINKRDVVFKSKNNNMTMAEAGSNKFFFNNMKKEAQSTGVYKMNKLDNVNNATHINDHHIINNNNIVMNKPFVSKKKEQDNFSKSKCGTSTLYNNKKRFIQNAESMNRTNYYDKGMHNINNKNGSSFLINNNSNLSLYNNMRKKKKKKRDYKNADGNNKTNANHNFSHRDDYGVYKKKKLYNDNDPLADTINDDMYNMNNINSVNNINSMNNVTTKGLYQNVFHGNTTPNNDNRKNEQFIDENNYEEDKYMNNGSVLTNGTYDNKMNDIPDYMRTLDKKNNIHNMNTNIYYNNLEKRAAGGLYNTKPGVETLPSDSMNDEFTQNNNNNNNNLYVHEKNKTNGNLIKDMKKKTNKTANTNISKDSNNNNNNNVHTNCVLYKNNQNNEHVVLDDIYKNIDLPDEELVNEVIKNTDILNNILKSKIENMKLWNNEQRIQVLSIQKALQLKGYTLK